MGTELTEMLALKTTVIRAGAALLSSALICSCASTAPVKKEPKKVTANVEKDFRSTEKLAKSGDSKKAMPRLKHFVQANPDTELTGEAYYLMGMMSLNAQSYPDALNAFSAVLNLSVSSSYEVDAAFHVARLQLRASQPAEAEKTLARSARWKNLSSEESVELLRLHYEAANAQKKYLEALDFLIQLNQSAATQADRDKFKNLAIDSLDSRLSEDELRTIADSSHFAFLQPVAQFRYGLLTADKKLYSTARQYFSSVTSSAPGTELAERAQALITQIDLRNRVADHTIGVVLPLTGKQAPIGYKALRGIQLGLGIYGNHGKSSGFRLAVVDSEGNPDTARHAIERLVQEDNVIAIIGGLLSKTAGAEAAKAQEFGVPTILLSQKAGVTQAGEFVFRNALTSQMQVAYLVDTAMTKLGMKSFAILFPNDAYGVEYTNLFWDEVRAHGGEIRGAQPYEPAETDFRGYVQRLVGTFYLEDRVDEYRLLAKAWNEKNPKRSGQHAVPAPEDLLAPIVDFDAVFIPDSAKAVGQIAPMLAYSNVTGVRLLGTNLWNSPGLVNRGQKFVEGAVFVDSYLSTDPGFIRSEFFTSYHAAFDEEPGLTEVQAYDSALILRQSIAAGENTRAGLQARLAGLENFPGALGALAVNSNREFRRPLAAITVKDGKITDLEARPRQ